MQKTATYRILAALFTLLPALVWSAAAETTARVPLPPSNPAKTGEKQKQLSSKPASALFSEKQLPSIGNAVAIGYYPRGCLQGGVELPTTGPNWQVMRVSRNRNWGHPELVTFLERFAPLAAKATGWHDASQLRILLLLAPGQDILAVQTGLVKVWPQCLVWANSVHEVSDFGLPLRADKARLYLAH